MNPDRLLARKAAQFYCPAIAYPFTCSDCGRWGQVRAATNWHIRVRHDCPGPWVLDAKAKVR